MLGRYQAIANSPNKRLRNVAATILTLSLVAPAMAQTAFPDFDFKNECEIDGRMVAASENGKYFDKTAVTNDCLDKEASARESAEYKWGMASEDVRAKAMAQTDYSMRFVGVYARNPFYRYLDSNLSLYSAAAEAKAAARRLSEKRPGVNY